MVTATTPLSGLLILKPKVFTDGRGHFLETFNQDRFAEATGTNVPFVQDNESLSGSRVLRGLHFQVAPHAQGKLVHVVRGAVLDVCVDIRPRSATFGQHFKIRLDDKAKEMLWIPPGFAHGFVVLEPDAVFAYKCTAFYHPASERTLRWNDPDLAIDWGTQDPVVSDKDAAGMSFAEFAAATQAAR
ncbi:MAG: dTDP-4-dehydrorhamnose 3,5-epimerase [Flavobacteriales bacterium]|nr:dTDP-4-dehydrorhamnose 3,5-epimerase [Flavobacteriales bacterium]